MRLNEVESFGNVNKNLNSLQRRIHVEIEFTASHKWQGHEYH